MNWENVEAIRSFPPAWGGSIEAERATDVESLESPIPAPVEKTARLFFEYLPAARF